MQTSDFEKMVSSQMEDFHLKPNDEVWEKVAKRIRPEKKRRAIILWLLPTLFLLGTGIYFVATYDNHGETKFSSQIKNKSKEVKTGGNAIPQVTEFKKETNPEKESVLNNQPVQLKNTTPKNLADNRKVNFKINNINQLQSAKEVRAGKVSKLNQSSKNENSTSDHNKHAENKIVESITDKEQAANETPFVVPQSDVSPVDGETHPKLIDSFKTAANAPAPKIEKQNSNDKKWKFSITGLFGVSNMMVKNNSNKTLFSSSSVSNPGSFSQAGSAQKPYSTALSPGIGIQFQKQLSAKLSISLGANYQLYNANTKVGQFVDSLKVIYDSVLQNSIAVDSYYKKGSSTNHREQYHFIQLPVNISYQLNKNIDRPILFYGGVTTGILIASNSLLYNNNAGVFYENNTQLRKWNLSVQSGFSFPILDKKSFSFQLGPEFQYQLMSTIKKQYSTNEKLFFIGVKANLILKK